MNDPQWPPDDRPVNVEDLVEPICEAIRFAYTLQRQNVDQDIPYTGLDIGEDERANALRAHYQLTAKQLAYSEDDQGRDALTEIIGLAMPLGIEQGRRIFKNSSEYRTLQIQADMGQMLMADRDQSKEGGNR